MKILCIGDMIGRPGREILSKHLRDIVSEYDVDFVVSNVENSARGAGITYRVYQELLEMPIDAMTGGNHIFRKKDSIKHFDDFNALVRPLNFHDSNPGQGIRYFECQGLEIAVVNLIGRVFMNHSDCPFQKIEEALPDLQEKADVILVDFHAEATSEKQAMGFFLDGKVSAVFGTHTHVQTADEHLLPEGTAYISDLGMVGSEISILGVKKEPIIKRFVDQMPIHHSPSDIPPFIFCGIVLTIDPETGKATDIERIFKRYDS